MKINTIIALISLLTVSLAAQANYQLDNDASSINFISIKKAAIAEVHTFKRITGSINSTGFARLTVDLSSVETNIPIRNQRMQAMLFETGAFPNASVTAQLNSEQLNTIKTGEEQQLTIEFKFELHGSTKLIDANVRVVGLKNGALLVSSVTPIILNAADFTLTDGIQKLMTVASLPSIASAVPVTFSLIFKPIQ